MDNTTNILGVRYREAQVITADLLRRELRIRANLLSQHLRELHGHSEWGVTGCEVRVIEPNGDVDEKQGTNSVSVLIREGQLQGPGNQQVDVKQQLFELPDKLSMKTKTTRAWLVSLLIRDLRTQSHQAPSLVAVPIIGIRENAVPLAIVQRLGKQLMVDCSIRYPAMIGERIESPTGKATVNLGQFPGDSLHRFSLDLHLRDELGNVVKSDRQIFIDRNTRTTLKGTATVFRGNLWQSMVSPHNPAEPTTFGFSAFPPPEEEAIPRPWSIYTQQESGDGPTKQAFRVEIENPGPDSELARYQFVVGPTHVEKSRTRFKPILAATPEPRTYVFGAPPPSELTTNRSADESKNDPATQSRALPAALVVKGGVIREKSIQPTLSDPLFAQRVFRETVAGELTIEYMKAEINEQGDLTYSINIKNVGQADLSAVQVFQSVYRAPTSVEDLKGTKETPEEIWKRVKEGSSFAIDFSKLKEIRPDKRLQRKVADFAFLKMNGIVPPLNVRIESKDLPSSLASPSVITVSILAFGTAAVGSLVYAIRAKNVQKGAVR